jgi:hypothetical protein
MKLVFPFKWLLVGLLYRTDFRREHMRVLGSGVTALSENDSVREAGFPELAQEGNSFLRTRNSRKPIRFTRSVFLWQRARKDQFRSKCRSTAPDYTCKLALCHAGRFDRLQSSTLPPLGIVSSTRTAFP